MANGIIMQAVADYRTALGRAMRCPENQGAMHDALELERFFHSGWYRILTEVDGDYLIDSLRKEAAKKYKIKTEEIDHDS
jgi:hypothetical protein